MVLKTEKASESGSRVSTLNVQMVFFNEPDDTVTHGSGPRPRHDTANRLGDADLGKGNLDNNGVCRNPDAQSARHTST